MAMPEQMFNILASLCVTDPQISTVSKNLVLCLSVGLLIIHKENMWGKQGVRQGQQKSGRKEKSIYKIIKQQ